MPLIQTRAFLGPYGPSVCTRVRIRPWPAGFAIDKPVDVTYTPATYKPNRVGTINR